MTPELEAELKRLSVVAAKDVWERAWEGEFDRAAAEGYFLTKLYSVVSFVAEEAARIADAKAKDFQHSIFTASEIAREIRRELKGEK